MTKFNTACKALLMTSAAGHLLQTTTAAAPPPSFSTSTSNAQAQPTCSGDLTKDLIWDKEACPHQFIGFCNAGMPGPAGCPEETNCFDCNPCQEHNFDRNACVQNECFFCPGDGLCLSQPVGDAFFSQFTDDNKPPSLPACTSESDWVTTTTPEPNTSVFSDPAYNFQKWAFDLLQVEPVWRQGLTGKGVVVRVNDPEGVDVTHPEFAGRFSVEASCEEYLPYNMTLHPWDGRPADKHGTAVASLAVAGADNNECAVGIAPGATLSACLAFAPPGSTTPEDFFDDGIATTHISVNSWGVDACGAKAPPLLGDDGIEVGRGHNSRFSGYECPFVLDVEENPCNACALGVDEECRTQVIEYCGKHSEVDVAGCSEALDIFLDCNFNTLSERGRATLSRGVTEGRDGKGIIYVVASGNEYAYYENVNFEGWLNTRFTIVVGAVGKDGLHASYSSTGAAVFVSGPGGDFENYNNNVAALPGGGCYSTGVGTSFSTPQVAGAIALLLEANPSLTWRDVQGIIATTSSKTDPESPTWSTNGVGLHHSDFYGFGIMNVDAAVMAARDWVNFGTEEQILLDSGIVNIPIADDESLPVISKTKVNGQVGFYTESVVVYLQLEHASRGNLEVVLTSPSGMKSVLSPGKFPESTQMSSEERWKLMTVKNWGEDPTGDWTLTVTDKKTGSYTTPGECVDFPLSLTVDELPGMVFDCSLFSIDIEGSRLCADGLVLSEEVDTMVDTNGRAPAEACCACGGGNIVPTENKLVSWSLAVYGHADRNRSAEGKMHLAPPAPKSNEPTSTAKASTPTSGASDTNGTFMAVVLTVWFASVLTAMTLFA
ncbi:Furin-like protease 1, isoform 1 [Seminavis robusta]|uniref:subtilisin n=1 Tax=Seminavis robusta TaxID=568900 RepID=A0A9N8F2J8_9STRA|nr:Furin-like protease 1, isoform 1 [Seminavis robusta]|eukprot:Sro2517_g330010.1 Furin-like protease 1, isoform 1 (830) ;mRNA; r:3330-6337